MINVEKIASWLAAKGVAENRLAWRLVHTVWPTLAGLVTLFNEAMQPENQIIWWYDPAGGDLNPDALLHDLSEIINRAPTPLGMDNYTIIVARLGRIPGDEQGVDGDRAEATLRIRKAQTVRYLRGNRWRDWKRGHGRQNARAILEQLRPCPEAPVTIIQAAVTGAGVARTLRALGAL